MKASITIVLISLFVFFYVPDSTLAQAPDTLWTKSFGNITDAYVDERC